MSSLTRKCGTYHVVFLSRFLHGSRSFAALRRLGGGRLGGAGGCLLFTSPPPRSLMPSIVFRKNVASSSIWGGMKYTYKSHGVHISVLERFRELTPGWGPSINDVRIARDFFYFPSPSCLHISRNLSVPLVRKVWSTSIPPSSLSK